MLDFYYIPSIEQLIVKISLLQYISVCVFSRYHINQNEDIE